MSWPPSLPWFSHLLIVTNSTSFRRFGEKRVLLDLAPHKKLMPHRAGQETTISGTVADGTGESMATTATASNQEQAVRSPMRTTAEASPREEAAILVQDVVSPEEPHGARTPL